MAGIMIEKGEIENYILQSRLGSGAFAQVFRAVHRHTGNTVAIKMIDVYRLTERNSKLKENLNYEIKILKLIHHPNIVTLYDVLEPPPPSDSYIYMIMECCEGGDFSSYIRKHKKLTEEKALYFMRQLANGLRFLRMNDIIHRDLKPQNLLLSDSSDSPTLKIADFGFARFIDVQSLSDTFCGSPLYMAPEILYRKNYTVKADLWSVGVILYEMLVGEPPYNCGTVVDLFKQLENNKIRIPNNVTVSSECQDLLFSLLQINEMTRISWEDFFLHPWLGFSQNIPLSNLHQPYQFNQPSQQTTPLYQQPAPIFYQQQPTQKGSPSSNNYPFALEYNQQTPNNIINNNSSNTSSTGSGQKMTPNSDRILLNNPNLQQIYNNDKKNNSNNTTSSSSIDFEKDCVILDDEEAVNNIEKIGKRAVAIAELGDLRQYEPSECIPLYIKSLMLIKSKLQQSAQNFSFGSPHMVRYNALMEKLRDTFREYLKKTIALYTNNVEMKSSFSPNKLIYETALEMGRNGGVQEMYKDFTKSLQYYSDGILLLEYLYSIAIDKEDQDILNRYIKSFSERINVVNRKSLLSK